MIAVLMMFKDEEDIIGQCISHWRHSGADKIYIANNGSTDRSVEVVMAQPKEMNCKLLHVDGDDFPQRKTVNYLRRLAMIEGCEWFFPIDADEFITAGGFGYIDIKKWLAHLPFRNYQCGQYQYKNIMPNGVSWFEPEHRKVFGRLHPDWNISIGNHEIEGVAPTLPSNGIYLDHYQYRSYEQFKRKKITFFKAFEKAGYLDHKFVKEYRLYQKHGEAYLEQMWDYLLRGVTEFEFQEPK